MKRALSQLEDQVISELDEPFRSRFLAIVARVNDRIKDDDTCYLVVRDGWRDPARQLQLYNQGRYKDEQGEWRYLDPIGHKDVVTYAGPGKSAHEYRRAAHIILLDKAARTWLADSDIRWQIIGQECARFLGSKNVPGVEYGGNWKRLRDLAHIEDFHWKRFAATRAWKGLGKTERNEGELCPQTQS